MFNVWFFTFGLFSSFLVACYVKLESLLAINQRLSLCFLLIRGILKQKHYDGMSKVIVNKE